MTPSGDPELEAYGARLTEWAASLKSGLVQAVSGAAPWADGRFWSWVVLDREGHPLRHSMNPARPEAARLLAVLQASAPPAPERWNEVTARIHLWKQAPGGSWQTGIAELRALPDRAERTWLEDNRLALKLETGRWTPPEGIQAPETGGAPAAWLLQFTSRPSLAQRAELESRGIALERYVTGHAYLARLSGDAPRALASLADLRAALPPPPGLPAAPPDPTRLPDVGALPPQEALEALARWKQGLEGSPQAPLAPADLEMPDVAFDRELDLYRERVERWLEEHASKFEAAADPARRRTKIPYRIWWRAGPRGTEDSGNPLDEGVAPLLARLGRLPPVPIPRCCRGAIVVIHLGYLGPRDAWGGRLISVATALSREGFIERHTTAYQVHLKGRDFYPERRIDAEGIRAAAKGRRGDRVHFFIQLMADAPLSWRKALEAMGVQALDSAGSYCLVASAPDGALEALAHVEGVRAAFPMLPSDKKGDGISDGRFDPWALLPDGRVKLYVHFHQDADQAHAEARVRELGGEVAQVEWLSRRMRVVGPPKLGDALAELDEVQYVAEAEPPLVPA